jgi:cytochrome c oxidase subunit 1
MNALVWTTFFICGFLQFVATRAFGMPLASCALAWITYGLMTAGLVLAAIPLLSKAATVMFTFYPPLQAHWAFYVGLTLVVVGTWLVMLNLALTYRTWRAQHPGARTPLAAFMTLITFAMWTIASLGLAAEMLGMLIPWSLGWQRGTDPLLARTLFWFSGHPIVYFWLLPTYVSWYTLVPQQAGGKLFSDPMARGSFILFLLLSTPVGMHHQFTDPGIGQGWKLAHAFLTFAVFFPSLLTFFNVVASLESGARARGGRGLLAWFTKLPWGDPSLTAQILAMLLFAFGGIGGLVNASYSLNLVVHNTAYIVGHFHLTVGTAVTLSFMGITYWLVPVLRGRGLWSPRLALLQSWLWFVGMGLFSFALHDLGILQGHLIFGRVIDRTQPRSDKAF